MFSKKMSFNFHRLVFLIFNEEFLVCHFSILVWFAKATECVNRANGASTTKEQRTMFHQILTREVDRYWRAGQQFMYVSNLQCESIVLCHLDLHDMRIMRVERGPFICMVLNSGIGLFADIAIIHVTETAIVIFQRHDPTISSLPPCILLG